MRFALAFVFSFCSQLSVRAVNITIKVCAGFSDGGVANDACCFADAAGLHLSKLAWDRGVLPKAAASERISLNFDFVDTEGDPGKAISCAYTGWYEEQAALVLGGGWSSLTKPMAQLGAFLSGAQLDWGGTSDQLSDAQAYPLLARTAVPDAGLAIGMAELLVTQYNVSRLAILHETGDWGLAFASKLVAEMYLLRPDVNLGLVPLTTDPSPGDEEQLRRKFRQVKRLMNRYYVVASQKVVTYQVLAEEEFSYIVGPETILFGPEDCDQGLKLLNSTARSKFQGMQLLKAQGESIGSNRSLLANLWMSLTTGDFPEPLRTVLPCAGAPLSAPADCFWGGAAMFGNDNILDETYFAWAFDAVWLVQLAAQQLITAGHAVNEVKGELLHQAILSTSAYGLNGRIALKSNGDRIVSLYGLVYLDSDGMWKDSARYDSVSKRLSVIVDPVYADNSTNRPMDTFSPCRGGWFRDGIQCTPAPQGWHVPAGLFAAPVVCPPGTLAFGIGNEFCGECSGGRFQSLPGQSECMDCQPGKFTSGSRTTACDLCPLGTFQVTSGRSACDRCNFGSFANVTVASACTQCHGSRTTTFRGSISGNQCICAAGSYSSGGPAKGCAPCPEGMTCGLGADLLNWGGVGGATKEGTLEIPAEYPKTLPGFMTLAEEWPTSGKAPPLVYRCLNVEHCPGGSPGACAPLRKQDSVACGRCEAGAYEADGQCKECSGVNTVANVVVAVLICLLVLGFATFAVNRDVLKQSNSMTGALMMCGILFTGMQTLVVINSITLGSVEPISSIMRALTVLNFNLDILSLSCGFSIDPVSQYAIRQFIPLMLAFTIFVVCAGKKVLIKPELVLHTEFLNTLGTIFSALFLSIVVSALVPLVCYAHPGTNRSSILTIPSILCFQDQQHISMMILGILSFSVVSCPFWAFAMLGTWFFPRWVARGDESSNSRLWMFRWLFYRFKPETYYYGIGFLTRSLLISLVPVLPGLRDDRASAVIMMCILLQASVVFQAWLQPWRAHLANIADAVMTSTLLLLLICNSMFTQFDVQRGNLETTSLAIFVIWISVGVLTAGWFLYMRVKSSMYKPFQYFICHHKAGAGSFSRLLKQLLTSSIGFKKSVFIDSDDLKDLDRLFDYVASSTDSLVILCSAEIMSRPWCLGEMVSAKGAGVKTIKLILPGFLPPSREFIEGLVEKAQEFSLLTERGITVAMVQDMLRWLSDVPEISLPAYAGMRSIQEAADMLVHNKTGPVLEHCDVFLPGTKVAVIVDHSSFEAAACGFVLAHLLRPHFQADLDSIPVVLPKGSTLPKTTQTCLIICTPGAFQQREFLQSLLVAAETGVKYIPILADDQLRFPTRIWLEEQRAVAEAVSEDPTIIMDIILMVFTCIAIVFQPSQSSSTEGILIAKAKEVAERMTSQTLKSLTLEICKTSENPSSGSNFQVENARNE
ncbi:unnamed protein product [Polarella glacialis]|uniref:Receptor ligand binding region domain-containing protein n=1 Tax=Polarella glacialis TaxID=89957 RepID=A0A813FRX9_POLGL|nr:unnamed protein product [Polarella glacialis]